jgi:hypothetical protein
MLRKGAADEVAGCAMKGGDDDGDESYVSKEVGRSEAMEKAAIGKKPTTKVELGVSGDGRKVQPRSQTVDYTAQ